MPRKNSTLNNPLTNSCGKSDTFCQNSLVQAWWPTAIQTRAKAVIAGTITYNSTRPVSLEEAYTYFRCAGETMCKNKYAYKANVMSIPVVKMWKNDSPQTIPARYKKTGQ